jgi:predicted metalloprotease with PDZ domain
MLAHEIAHGWLSMQGEHGQTAWFSEGAAEYYSIVLSRRAGVLDEDQFLKQINERAVNYFSHPFRSLTNEEAARRFWSDAFIQQVPYGRGFFYLAATDAAIRASSGGRHNLDDLIQALRARQAKGEPYGVAEWLSLVGAEIGRKRAEREFQSMSRGEIVRPSSAFGPCYMAVPSVTRKFEIGFSRSSVNDGVVRDLRPGSTAALAGVREGDVIIEHSELPVLASDASREMVLTLNRKGERQTVRYLPRGELVETYRWVRHPRATTPCNM